MIARQNKSLILLWAVLFVLIFCAQGFTAEGKNPLPGFIGIKSGANIKSLDHMILTDEKGPFFRARMLPADSYAMYTRSGDVMKFFDVEVNAIYYLFFDDQFTGYAVERKGESFSRELLQEIEKVYGEGVKRYPKYIHLNRGALVLRAEWNLSAFEILYFHHRPDKAVAIFHAIPRPETRIIDVNTP